MLLDFLNVEITSSQEHIQHILKHGCEKKTSANLPVADLPALPCRMGEFSCVPPRSEDKTNSQQLVQNFCQLFLANGPIVSDFYVA